MELLSVAFCWVRDIEFMKTKVYTLAKTLGGNANPFDAFLADQWYENTRTENGTSLSVMQWKWLIF